MATRNLTTRFEVQRNKAKSRRSRISPPDTIQQSLLHPEDKVAIAVGLDSSLPPEWVDVVESIQGNLADIRTKTRALGKLHSQRLEVRFGDDDAEKEREIEIQTQEITRLFHKAENGLKRIATIGNLEGTNLPAKERVVRLNVMRALAAEMQELSKTFRQQQRDFIMSLKGREEIDENWGFKDDQKHNMTFDEALDRGFSRENMAQLQELEQHASEREKEIIKLVSSINELAQLFRELNVLVVEQGSIVDRIDYNVEQVLTKVKSANVELKQADDYSKRARSIVCIFILLLVVIILLAILIYKHRKK